MADLHKKIYGLSSSRVASSSSLNYGNAIHNNNNNNRISTKSLSSSSNTHTGLNINTITKSPTRIPPTSSRYNELDLVGCGDYDDDELDPAPPGLSSYALSLLQSNNNTQTPSSHTNRSRNNSSIGYTKSSVSTRHLNSDNVYSNKHTPVSNNNEGLDSVFESHKSSRHSFRFMSKVGLGAPRRLADDEITTYQGGTTTDDVKTSYSTNVFTNHSIRNNTTTGLTHKYDSLTTSNSNSNSNSNTKGSTNSRKHQLTITPSHEPKGENHVITNINTNLNDNYSPAHKRNNNSTTPYKRIQALSLGQATIESRFDFKSPQNVKTGHQQQTQIQHTPTPKKNEEFDMYATPERARKVLTPLSHCKSNIPFDIFADQRNNKENVSVLPIQSSKQQHGEQLHRDLLSYDQEHFKSILAKELQAQKEQILKEVKKEQVEAFKKEKEQEKVVSKSKSNNNQNTNVISINNQEYECLELIGKGGSSKVYKARSLQNTNRKTFAVKIVTFDQHDDQAVIGFKGEIGILKKLKNVDRAVQLFDHSLKSGLLMVVLECGEIDLAHVLSARLNRPLDTSFIRYHATEMMKCVKAVHDMGIVHSDLKPANFLFVKGVLKLIDFGISNALTDDQTMNIYRECQIGTPNYMAPETLIEANQTLRLTASTVMPTGKDDYNDNDLRSGTWKVGKPADIWSCGCIIYQMVYGKPPYAQYSGSKKILAITNPKIEILYPRTAPKCGTRINGLIIDLIKSCLNRDVKNRSTADDVLNMPFLNPKLMTQKFMDDLVRNAVKYGSTHSEISEKRLNTLVNDVWKRVNEYS